VETVLRFVAPPGRCEYLPQETARLEYEQVKAITPAEYQARLHRGWRRFGHVLFRPACSSCRMCQSLRVPVRTFAPHRTQRRIWKANAGRVRIAIGPPAPTAEKRRLYEKFHGHQQTVKGWPAAETDGLETFAHNPLPTEEWSYFLEERLVAVGYVDVLPDGLSAMYFFYDPDERRRSLGTFNVLSIIAAARQRGLDWSYLGYYVRGCRSLEYKALFRPNEVLSGDRAWVPFLR
jgi:arginyl-tRNA--protein-N-Asp/Glu arginylyltransferase